MPKIIAALRSTILARAGEILLARGYDRLTMRAVAEACGVAAGTLYNYFPSKDMLVATVILEDWQKALEQMSRISGDTALLRLEGIFSSLVGFYQRYHKLWQDYSDAGHTSPINGKYHALLVEQLGTQVARALEGTPMCTPLLPSFLAETFLSAAPGGMERFRQLCPILQRLI